MAILDAYGNPIKLPAKPKKGYGVAYRASTREYDFSTRTLTPTGLWSAAVAADDGDVSALQTYFEKAPRHDGRLYDLIQRRLGGVTGLEWEWKPYQEDKDKEPEAEDVENRNLVADVFERVPNIQDHLRGIMGALPCGFAVWDINWVDSLDGNTLRPYLWTRPQRCFTFQRENRDEIVTDDWPRVLTDTASQFGEALDPSKTIVAIYRDAAEPWHCGIMQSVIWYWLRKRQIWSQLMATGERFAEPIPVGYYGVDEQNGTLEADVLDLIQAYGPGCTVALPGTGAPLSEDKNGATRGAYLDLKQPDLRIPQGFWGASLETCDREIAIAFSGGNLLTDTTGGTGTFAAIKEQHTSETDDIRRHDVDWLTLGPVQELARLILLYNNGQDAAERLPTLTLPGLEPADDLELKSRVYANLNLINWDNFRSMPQEIREVFEIPEIAESDEPEGAEPEETEPPPSDEPPTPGEGPGAAGKTCTCPECGYEQSGEGGVPCQDMTCPKCGASMLREIETSDITAAAPSLAAAMKDMAKLVAQADPFNKEAAEAVTDRVTAYLLRMKRPPKTAKAFQKAVLKHIDMSYDELAEEMDNAGMSKWFETTYKKYKTQDRALWGTQPPPPAAITFGARDLASAKHMADQAYWHFSSFTDNDTFREPIQKFLTKTYMDDGAQLFVRDEKIVKAFGMKLGDTTKDLASHEIDRIARTSVARAREQARIMQMADAGVTKAVVTVHPDACPICKQYEGAVLDVTAEVTWMENLETLEGDSYHDALKEHGKKALKGVPPHEFPDGAGGPLYHPNCRCGVDMQ